jgi:amyloid beta (A4) precursor protein-binding family B protein 2 (Fe65-like)
LIDYRLVDDDGPYYWHIKSGTIQREPPENKDSSSQPAMNFQRQVVREAEVGSYITKCLNLINYSFLFPNVNKAISASFTPVVPRSTTSFTLSDLDIIRSKEDMAFKYNF